MAACCARAQSTYTPYIFTTFAGDATDGQGTNDGTGSAAQFYYPSGVAVDSSANVYVSDRFNNTIRKITPDGVVTTLAGQPGIEGSADGTNSGAQFFSPSGVAVDSAGNVYVADQGNCAIRVVSPAGVVTTLAGGSQGSSDGTGSAAQFYNPFGVAVDRAGNVYVADTLNDTIRKVTSAGVVTTFAGKAGYSGSANGASNVARFSYPFGIAIDSAGNLYVADAYNDMIRKVTPGGTVSTLAGKAGYSGSIDGTGTAAEFENPIGVAVDSKGYVYVGDFYNNTIRRVSSNGVVTTLAGLAGNGGFGSADGTGSAARFDSPEGVAVDSQGNLYVGDVYNDTIRKGWSATRPPINLVFTNSIFSSHQFVSTLTGPIGSNAVIFASPDLQNWTALLTNSLGGGTLMFTDTLSPNFPARFYRATLTP